MAAWGYEFYLLVLKVSLTTRVSFAHLWEILSALEDKICITARPCNILYLYKVKNIRHKLKILKTVLHMMKQSRQFLQCFASFWSISFSRRKFCQYSVYFGITLWASLNALQPALLTCTNDARNDSGCSIYLKPFSGLCFSKEKSFSVDISISCPRRAMHMGAGVRKSAQFILEEIIIKAVSFLSSPELASIKALLSFWTVLESGSDMFSSAIRER